MNKSAYAPFLRFLLVFLFAGLLSACGDNKEPTPPPKPIEPVVVEPDGAEMIFPATRLGEGMVNAVGWSPDEQWFGVTGSFGTWVYHSEQLDQPPLLLPSSNRQGGRWLTFSPDSHWIVIADGTGIVQVWDLPAAELRYEFQMLATNPNADPTLSAWYGLLAFSQDSQLLAYAYSGSVSIWDLTKPQNQQPETYIIPEQVALGMTFDTRDRLLIAGSDDNNVRISFENPAPAMPASPDYTIRVWNIRAGRPISEFVEPLGTAYRVEFMRGGTEALAYLLGPYSFEGSRSGNPVMWWNTDTGQLLGQIPVEFGASQTVFSSPFGFPWAVNLRSVTKYISNEPQQTTNGNEVTFSVTFDDEKARLVRYSQLTLIDIDTGDVRADLVTTFENPASVFSQALFSPSLDRLAAVNEYGQILFWDLGASLETSTSEGERTLGNPTVTLDRFTRPLQRAVFNADGRKLAAIATFRGPVWVWDIEAYRSTIYPTLDDFLDDTGSTFELFSLSIPGYSSNGEQIAQAGSQAGSANTILVKQRKTDEVLSTLPVPFALGQIAFSPNGQTVAAGGTNGMIAVWDAASGRQQVLLQAHTSTIIELAFTPDGKRLISHGSTQHTSGASLAVAQELSGVTVSGGIMSSGEQPEGQGLAIDHPVIDNSIRIWDTATGQMIAILEPRQNESFEALAIHPDGELLAIAVSGPESVIRLWNLADNQTIDTLHRRDDGLLTSLVFNRDGTMLAATDFDGIVWIWEMP